MRSWIIISALNCLVLLFSLCSAAAWWAIPKPGCVKDAGKGQQQTPTHNYSPGSLMSASPTSLLRKHCWRWGENSFLHPPQTNYNATLKLTLKHPTLTLLTCLFPSLWPHHQLTFQLLFFFLSRNIPPDLLTQHQPLQFSTCLLPVLAAAFHSLLVTHPYASPYTQGLQTLSAPLILNHIASHDGHDVGLSLYGLLLVPQKTNFGSDSQELVSDRQWVSA